MPDCELIKYCICADIVLARAWLWEVIVMKALSVFFFFLVLVACARPRAAEEAWRLWEERQHLRWGNWWQVYTFYFRLGGKVGLLLYLIEKDLYTANANNSVRDRINTQATQEFLSWCEAFLEASRWKLLDVRFVHLWYKEPPLVETRYYNLHSEELSQHRFFTAQNFLVKSKWKFVGF